MIELRVYFDVENFDWPGGVDEQEQHAANIAGAPMVRSERHADRRGCQDHVEMLFRFKTEDAMRAAKVDLREAGFRFVP